MLCLTVGILGTVFAVELHGKHAVLRDDFDSNKQGELDPNIWWVEKVTASHVILDNVFPVSAGPQS